MDVLPHLKPCPIFPTRGHLCLHPHPLLSLTVDNLPDLLPKPSSQLGKAASSYNLHFVLLVSGVTLEFTFLPVILLPWPALPPLHI